MSRRRHSTVTLAMSCALGAVATLSGCGPAHPAAAPSPSRRIEIFVDGAHPSPTGTIDPHLFPATPDAYTQELVLAWQRRDQARLTSLAGPSVAAFVLALNYPLAVEPFQDTIAVGRSSVHVLARGDAAPMDITVDIANARLGQPHAITDIYDANADETITD